MLSATEARNFFMSKTFLGGLSSERVAAGLAGTDTHDLFERDGLDLLVQAPVPMALAALGKGVLIADARPDLDRLHLLADPDDES